MNQKHINKVHRLIDEYINCASFMCNILKDTFNIDGSLLIARREKRIPKEGSVEGINFSFHGVGCYFEYEGGHIDVDFTDNGNCNGFDEFRLHDFVTGMAGINKNDYSEILREAELKKQFDQLKTLGVIYCPQLNPSPHLYFLSENN